MGFFYSCSPFFTLLSSLQKKTPQKKPSLHVRVYLKKCRLRKRSFSWRNAQIQIFFKKGDGGVWCGILLLAVGKGGGVAHGRYNNQWCLKSFSNFWHRYSHSLFYQYCLLLVCEFHQIDLPDGERGAQAHRLTPPQNPHTDACMIHSQCNSGQVWNQKSQYYYFRVWNVLNCLMWCTTKRAL